MTRSIIRRVDWTCAADPSSPHPIYQFECTGCGEPGPADNLFERARDFVFQHVGANPSHTGFREVVTRYWRMNGEGVEQPPAQPDAAPCPECDGRGARVLPNASAETECSVCEGTGRDAIPLEWVCLNCHDAGCAACSPGMHGMRQSAPTSEYGAPFIPASTAPREHAGPVPPMHLGPVDAGALDRPERY